MDEIQRPGALRRAGRSTAYRALAAAALAGFAAGTASAAELDVPCDDLLLQIGLSAANENGEPDTLWLSPGCTYQVLETLLVAPDGGAPLTIQGQGAVLTASLQRRVAHVQEGASLELVGATVREGSAPNYGGGILNHGTLTVRESAFGVNEAVNCGGAIHTENGGMVTAINTTFFANYAAGGGALCVFPFSVATLRNSTLTGNFADPWGAGVFNLWTVRFENSIVANSVHGGDCLSNGTIELTGGTLIGDGSCAIPGMLTGDPRLGLPSGTPLHYPLLGNSPAIDAGSDDACPATDQRDAPRPQDGDKDGVARCDLGAVERSSAACGLVGAEALLLLAFRRRGARAG